MPMLMAFSALNQPYPRTLVSLEAQLVKNLPAMQETWVQSLGREERREWHPLQHSWASLVAQLVKNQPAMWKTWVWSLGWKDPLKKGRATHSSIMAWRIPWTTVHGVANSRTQLSHFHFTSSILAWRIPWTEEPGWLQSMRLQRHGLVTNTHTHTHTHIYTHTHTYTFTHHEPTSRNTSVDLHCSSKNSS